MYLEGIYTYVPISIHKPPPTLMKKYVVCMVSVQPQLSRLEGKNE